jgi:hypothetical protein
MTELDKDRVHRMARRILEAFDDGLDRVSLFGGDLTLRYANRGDIISDADCEDDFEALESGIFRRFRSEKGGEVRLVYLRLGPADPSLLTRLMSEEIEARGPDSLEEADIDLTFQTVMFRERSASRAMRLRV